MLRKIFKSRVVNNISWLVGGKIIQMIISFIVTMLTTRYLGPNNYGIISYVSSYISFFTQLCGLGLNNIIIKELVSHKTKEGEIIFTAIVMKLACSIISFLAFIPLMYIVNHGDKTIIIISLLLSLSLIFSSFEIITYWYQAKLKSKKTTIVSTIGYVTITMYRIILLILNKSVEWFAFANLLDVLVIVVLLIYLYFKDGGQKWSFSIKTAKRMLKQSYHFILSGIMIAIFSQTDKIMIGHMINLTEVGLYTVAVTIASLWSFIPSAIIDSLRPVIMEQKNVSEFLYTRRLKQLYAIIIWMSVAYGLFVTLFSKYIILIIYGKQYIGANMVLKIVVWYCAFSYLGAAKNIWLVCENKQKYEKWFTICGATMNVILNLCLIPMYGIIGAAIATLFTQIFTNFVLPFIVKDTRKSSIYMIEALFLKNIFNIKKFRRRKENG